MKCVCFDEIRRKLILKADLKILSPSGWLEAIHRLACYHYAHSLASCFSANYFSSSWCFKSVALMLYFNKAAALSETPHLVLQFTNRDTEGSRIRHNLQNRVANFSSWQHCPFVVNMPYGPAFCSCVVSAAFQAVLNAGRLKVWSTWHSSSSLQPLFLTTLAYGEKVPSRTCNVGSERRENRE